MRRDPVGEAAADRKSELPHAGGRWIPDIFQAADAVPSILQHKPIAIEGFNRTLVQQMQAKAMLASNIALLPGGDGWLFVEFGAHSDEESRMQARAFAASLPEGIQPQLIEPVADQKKLWEVRENALGATALVPGEAHRWEGWEDHAVAPDRLGAYLRDFQALLDEFGYNTAYYGHFGQGCVHVRMNFDLQTDGGIRHFRAFLDRAADLTVAHGGSLSGEHGDGQARGALLERMFGPDWCARSSDSRTCGIPRKDESGQTGSCRAAACGPAPWR